MAAAQIDCIEKIVALVPHLLGIPQKKICVDYDEMADVLYMNFKKPSHADEKKQIFYHAIAPAQRPKHTFIFENHLLLRDATDKNNY